MDEHSVDNDVGLWTAYGLAGVVVMVLIIATVAFLQGEGSDSSSPPLVCPQEGRPQGTVAENYRDPAAAIRALRACNCEIRVVQDSMVYAECPNKTVDK